MYGIVLLSQVLIKVLIHHIHRWLKNNERYRICIIVVSNEMKVFDWVIRIQHVECYC